MENIYFKELIYGKSLPGYAPEKLEYCDFNPEKDTVDKDSLYKKRGGYPKKGY